VKIFLPLLKKYEKEHYICVLLSYWKYL